MTWGNDAMRVRRDPPDDIEDDPWFRHGGVRADHCDLSWARDVDRCPLPWAEEVEA